MYPSKPVIEYLRASLAETTRIAYRGDLRRFVAWGGTIPATPELIATYLSTHGTQHKLATLERWKVSIGKAHRAQGLADPAKSELVKTVLRGIKRTHGTAQRQVAPAIKEDLLAMVGTIEDNLKGFRDKALLLIGFAGAFRRSELVALDVEYIEEVREGLVITLRRTKTDQEGAGRKIGIPLARGIFCPVKALRNWLAAAGIAEGAVFRGINRHRQLSVKRLSGHAVALIVKERATAANLDPSNYSGHSLRAGLATSAASAGLPSHKIRAQTGHKGEAMLARYIRDGQLFVNNAASIL